MNSFSSMVSPWRARKSASPCWVSRFLHSNVSQGFVPPFRKSPASARDTSFSHCLMRIFRQFSVFPIRTTSPPIRKAYIAGPHSWASARRKRTKNVDGGSRVTRPTRIKPSSSSIVQITVVTKRADGESLGHGPSLPSVIIRVGDPSATLFGDPQRDAIVSRTTQGWLVQVGGVPGRFPISGHYRERNSRLEFRRIWGRPTIVFSAPSP